MSVVHEFVSVRGLVVLVLIYCVAPYGLLWLGVKCWPSDHPRREELLTEYTAVPFVRRPFFVGDAVIMSICNGFAARAQSRKQSTRAERLRLLRSVAVADIVLVLISATGGYATSADSDGRLFFVIVGSFGLLLALGFLVWTRKSRQRPRVAHARPVDRPRPSGGAPAHAKCLACDLALELASIPPETGN